MMCPSCGGEGYQYDEEDKTKVTCSKCGTVYEVSENE